MVEQITFQTLFQFLQTVSIMAGIAYYLMILQNQQKTRQTQIFMQLYNQLSVKERQRDFIELMNYEWESYEDFEHKYGSDVDTESFAQRFSMMFYFEGVGVMLKDGWIDIDKVSKLLTNYPMWIWEKYESIILEQRVRYGIPAMFESFEYLATEIKRYTKKRHPEYRIPETFSRYVPDQVTDP
ncbi:hypothetical protein JXL21_06790 [Candidatus Bathyarchaeota archaeon]|nr:hypothetical protein [Candidatus Bathyarchaeota archaeon]